MPSDQPSVGDRLRAALRGGVPADSVRAYLRGGSMAYEDYVAAEGLRAELVEAGLDPWIASPAETSQLLCAWNAYALQSIADAFVDAEDRAAGGHARVMPQVTAEQVALLVRDVPAWSGRARRAAADPGYDVAAEVPLPAALPPWVVVEPCPVSHLRAMHSATGSMLDRLEAAIGDLRRVDSDRSGDDAGVLLGMLADLRGRLGFVDNVLAGSGTSAVHESAEATMRDAVSGSFVLGQVTARPRLLRQPSAPPWVAAGQSRQRGYPPPPGYYGHGHHGHHGSHGHH